MVHLYPFWSLNAISHCTLSLYGKEQLGYSVNHSKSLGSCWNTITSFWTKCTCKCI